MQILENLNQEQYEAVTNTEGPLLVIAGAGTGKTHMLISRVAYLVQKGVPPCAILLLTFTNKAAREMKDRAAKMLGDESAKQVNACTFHSFCVQILRRYGERIGLDPRFSILSSGDDIDIINMRKAEEKTHYYDLKGFPSSATIVKMISKAVNENMPLAQVIHRWYPNYEMFTSHIQRLCAEADSYKQTNSLLNYDDLLLMANRLLDDYPAVAAQLSGFYQYIMVDEYQDTNRMQEKLVFRLREGKNRNLAVVGDDMQSIYGFRGAKVQNIIDFPRKMEGCRIIYLTQNYRSNQEILDLANHVVLHATEGYQKQLSGTHHAGRKPVLLRCYSQSEESREAMAMIRERMEAGVPLNKICVLYRNSYLSAQIELLLNQFKINYVKYGGMKFFELSYVQDVLAYLRVLTNPGDEIAWFRILMVHAGIGQIYSRAIASACRTQGVSYLINNEYKKRKFYAELKLLYDEIRKLFSITSVPELVKEAVRFYIDTSRRNIKTMRTRDESIRTEKLNNLEMAENDLAVLSEIARPYSKVTDMLDDLVLENNAGVDKKQDENTLVLSTVHSVKGLEFDTIILLDCIDGIFPSTDVMDAGTEEDNEELRCFYVAVTRARECLWMIAPMYAKRYGKPINGFPSHYLTDGCNYYVEEMS